TISKKSGRSWTWARGRRSWPRRSAADSSDGAGSSRCMPSRGWGPLAEASMRQTGDGEAAKRRTAKHQARRSGGQAETDHQAPIQACGAGSGPGGRQGPTPQPIERRLTMPERAVRERARRDRREGKAPTTQAGEFVREEIEHVREGKHGARSTKQAIAIGLSKARRAGVRLKPPKRVSARTRRQAARDSRTGRSGRSTKPSARRSRATLRALEREGRGAASRKALA